MSHSISECIYERDRVGRESLPARIFYHDIYQFSTKRGGEWGKRLTVLRKADFIDKTPLQILYNGEGFIVQYRK